MIVSDHLLNHDGKETITDASSLKDIENVKGEETFTQDGQTLTWNAGGKIFIIREPREKTADYAKYYLLSGRKRDCAKGACGKIRKSKNTL